MANWQAKIKRDLDFKPVMELIMRQDDDALRMPQDASSLVGVAPLPIKLGTNDKTKDSIDFSMKNGTNPLKMNI